MTFAHTYGSQLAQSGLDPGGVQRQLGHARPSITMDRYVHEFETARRREQAPRVKSCGPSGSQDLAFVGPEFDVSSRPRFSWLLVFGLLVARLFERLSSLPNDDGQHRAPEDDAAPAYDLT
jgi:hypothetical protein